MNKHLTTQTMLVFALTLIAIALLSLTTANQLWRWFAPPTEAPAATALQPAYAVESSYGLFGAAPETVAASSFLPVTTSLAFRLLGVVAADGEGVDFAVIQIEPGHIVAIREGQDIAPGVVLSTVFNNHVILERAGSRETLAWPQP